MLLWHSRLGHASFKVIAFMAQHQKVAGLPQLSHGTQIFCSSCKEGKQSRKKIPKPPNDQGRRTTDGLRGADVDKPSAGPRERIAAVISNTRASGPMDLIHTDLCGPLSSPSLSGSRYVLTLTDDFSRFTWIFFLKTKDETLTKFRYFKALIELQGNLKIRAIRSDRGGEYISRDFQAFCDELGIVRQFSQSYTPHQNGVAERKNRSLMDKARSMAFASKLPAHLWPEAVSTANYLINRTSTRANSGTTPFEKLTGIIPSVHHLRIFGCRTFVLNTNPSLMKWAPRSTECIFLGYDSTSRGFRNYHKASRKILISKDVEFDERTFPYRQKALSVDQAINQSIGLSKLTSFPSYMTAAAPPLQFVPPTPRQFPI